MLLKDTFYVVDHVEKIDAYNAVFALSLVKDCEVYKGHFPHKPVCPGVCNVETIRECAEMLTEQDLKISTIKQCRLTAVAAPDVCPKVDVTIALTPNEDKSAYVIQAKIADATTSYMELKGELKIKN